MSDEDLCGESVVRSDEELLRAVRSFVREWEDGDDACHAVGHIEWLLRERRSGSAQSRERLEYRADATALRELQRIRFNNDAATGEYSRGYLAALDRAIDEVQRRSGAARASRYTYASCDACPGIRFPIDAKRCTNCGDMNKLSYGWDDAPADGERDQHADDVPAPAHERNAANLSPDGGPDTAAPRLRHGPGGVDDTGVAAVRKACPTSSAIYTVKDMGATATFDGDTLSIQVCGRPAVTVAVSRVPGLSKSTECHGRENCDDAERALIEQRDRLRTALEMIRFHSFGECLHAKEQQHFECLGVIDQIVELSVPRAGVNEARVCILCGLPHASGQRECLSGDGGSASPLTEAVRRAGAEVLERWCSVCGGPMTNGADDDMPGACGSCWNKAHAKQSTPSACAHTFTLPVRYEHLTQGGHSAVAVWCIDCGALARDEDKRQEDAYERRWVSPESHAARPENLDAVEVVRRIRNVMDRGTGMYTLAERIMGVLDSTSIATIGWMPPGGSEGGVGQGLAGKR